jgi:hypothetical protein
MTELEQKVKIAVFEKLHELKIESVDIEFDGCGDSGQIEFIRSTPEIDLESIIVGEFEIQVAIGYGPEGPKHRTEVKQKTLHDLIEELSYAYLEDMGHDWYNNDGGYGTITITASKGYASMDYHQRISSSEHYEFEFPWSEDNEHAVPPQYVQKVDPPSSPKIRRVKSL